MSVTPSKPFRRGRFEDLPAVPQRPHRFFDTEPHQVDVAAAGFGSMVAHVRRFGTGPPLLLVHGLMTSSYSWRYVLEPLGERFTCYAPDLPGNGRTPPGPMDNAYTADALATWIGAVQTALGIRGCPVIANSMGGYLAIRWALADPGAMSRLVNLHSPGLPEPRLWALRWALSAPGSHALLRWLIRRDTRRWAHRNVHYYDESLKSLEEAEEYGRPLDSTDGAQVLVKYLHETMDPAPMARMRSVLRRRREAGEGFPVPLQLLYAERDPMVPPRIGDALAELIPDAEHVRLERASHFAHVDATERFLPPVLRFLGSGSAAPPSTDTA